MKYDNNYKFIISLSTEGYYDKKIAGAMIGSCKDEKNKEIKREYGFKLNKGIQYYRTTTTPEELLNYLTNGYVACHLFTDKPVFSRREKRDDYFRGAYGVFIDIDETRYNNVNEFISVLEYKPTLYYTTYSNKKEGNGARFRLMYVFDDLLTNNRIEYRYIAWKVMEKIEKDTQEIIHDKCGLKCSQYFNGTNFSNPDLIECESGCTNIIYNQKDFDCTEKGYIDFLEKFCYYSAKTKINRIAIEGELERLKAGEIYATPLTKKEEKIVKEIEYDGVEEDDTKIEVCSDNIKGAMYKFGYDEFMMRNSHNYTYFYRVEKDTWINNSFQIIDEDYFALYYPVSKVMDKQNRRKHLYERMCLRRVMNPNVSADTLLFNAYVDREKFFDNSDGVLSIDCLVKNVERAMSLSIEEIEEAYSENIKYLRSQAPKDRIIYKRELFEDKAELNKLRKEAHYYLIWELYDNKLTIKENLIILNSVLPFKVSEKTLKRFSKEANKKSEKEEEIIKLINPSLSSRENEKILREKGYNISYKKIQRLIKKYNYNNCSSLIEEQHTIMDDPFCPSKEESQKYDTSAFLGGSNFGIEL